YAGDNGLYVDGSHNIIERCEFYGNCDTGLQLKNGFDNLIKNCDSHHNFDYQTGGTSSPDWGGNADGFADKQYSNTGAPNVFEGCRAWANSDDGWDFYQKVGNSVIRNSICYQNGQRSYDMTNHPRRLGIDAAWFNALADVSAVRNYGNGNGFKLGGLNTQHQVTVTNCLAVANNVKGFDQNNNYGTMTLYNNSAYNNGTDYGFTNSSGGTLIIKNSLSLASKSTNRFACKTVTSDHNSWNISNLTCTVADFVSLDSTIILSPRQPNGDLPVVPFMRLAQGSDLIDAGVDVGLTFAGAAPDLGCYESDYNPSSVINSTQTNDKYLKFNLINNNIELFNIEKISEISLYSLAGTMVLRSDNAEVILVDNLPQGYYFVKIKTLGGKNIFEKILKQ
ncbi:MAG: right-handed parallel beta-helix repeat-containing protein, partial [Paludibacter sp.]|nr:right-handed parallel beta-helix repeat-containing protein [Paludibacter sp.]